MNKDQKKRLKILVVEDNLINQKIMKAYLRKIGHDFDIAENGKEAIRLYKEEYYDCILMDIQMPEMDGIEATRLIRKYEKNTKTYTPIVAVTASSPYEDQREFIKVGMDEYVPKPVGMDILRHVLKNVIEGNYKPH